VLKAVKHGVQQPAYAFVTSVQAVCSKYVGSMCAVRLRPDIGISLAQRAWAGAVAWQWTIMACCCKTARVAFKGLFLR
jgi:hypothetical protein